MEWCSRGSYVLCEGQMCGFTTGTGFLVKWEILSSHGAVQVVKLYDLQIYKAQVEN